MSSRSDHDLLEDILEAARRAIDYCDVLAYENFLKDTRTQDAVVRNLEIMGEAAKGLSEHFRERHPDIPWRNISGMRDKLVHHYFGVNWDIVWDVVHGDLPQLAEEIRRILDTPRARA